MKKNILYAEVRNKWAEESIIFNLLRVYAWDEKKWKSSLTFFIIGDNGKNNFIYFFLKICLKSILKIYLNKSVYFFFFDRAKQQLEIIFCIFLRWVLLI